MKPFRVHYFAIIIALLANLFAMSTPSFATSYNVYLAGDGTFNNSATLYLSVSGSASMGGACGGICGVTGSLNYDSSKLELIAASGLQGFDFTQGGAIVLYKSTGAVDGSILLLRFRNIGLAPGESTIVSISDLTITNGDIEENIGTTAHAVQYYAPATNPGEQPTSPEATPANRESSSSPTSPHTFDEGTDTNSPAPTIPEKVTKSSEASLRAIVVSQGALEFDPKILAYDIVVASDVAHISISASAQSDKATIAGEGEYDLAYGSNKIKLTVVAEDGTEKEYIVTVYRDGALEALTAAEDKATKLTIALVAVTIFAILIIALLVAFFVVRLHVRRKHDILTNNRHRHHKKGTAK